MAPQSDRELNRERKAALRRVREAERAVDTKLEILERELLRLLKRKTLLSRENGQSISAKYTAFANSTDPLERALTDMLRLFSIGL